MSSSPDQQGSRHDGEVLATDIEALANEFIALFEEFEAEIFAGHVPRAFAERLAAFREAAERIIAR
jgi:hypothetical protein